MKKLIAAATLLGAALIFHPAQAKIWRVNNMPGVTADATTAQAAHDMASAGDTIHLESSPNNYGTLFCSKPLVWIGTGFYLTQNPGRQAVSGVGIISTVYFYAGSQGSKLLGLATNSSVNISVSNIFIERCYIESNISLISGLSDVVILQNVIYSSSINLSNCSNAIVKGNLVGNMINNSNGGTAVVQNNTIGLYSSGTADLHNSVFQNNILRGGAYNVYNSQFSYNLTSAASGLPVGNNNQFSINMADVFVNDGFIYQQRSDKDYQLKPGSPAIGAGAAGADCGAFGGDQPYVLALQPPIPAITAMGSPAQLNANTIQVTFSAKSNN